MSEMIEHIKDVINSELGGLIDTNDGRLQGRLDERLDAAAQKAIAIVLNTIREPTEEMKKAGARAVDYNSMIDEGEIADMWRAMVDAARAVTPENDPPAQGIPT